VTSPRQRATRARSAARRQLAQALYQWQVAGYPWQDVYQQFAAAPEFGQVDADYFREALMQIADSRADLDVELARHSEIAPDRLDPVEHAIIFLGLWELLRRPDVPYRVVINEAVELARRFGATDGHKFVNAVLDRASMVHRAPERGAA
jgi:N utilization substance protein B